MMDIHTYLGIVKYARMSPDMLTYDDTGESRRGKWRRLTPMYIRYSPQTIIDNIDSSRIVAIAYAEADLIMHGNTSSELVRSLYKDDDNLMQAYAANPAHDTLTSERFGSRNIIHHILGGCVSLIQRTDCLRGNTFDLTIYQRSHDIVHAGYSDPYMYAFIAQWIGDAINRRCKLIHWWDNNPHVYDNPTIARRHEAL